MHSANISNEQRRFLRTLRVATQTSLAFHDLTQGRVRSATSFFALAAKSVDDWRFPDAGLMSADGLVLARLTVEPQGTRALALQAQGAAGLATYAGRAVRLQLSAGETFEGVFDRDGRLSVAIPSAEIVEADKWNDAHRH